MACGTKLLHSLVEAERKLRYRLPDDMVFGVGLGCLLQMFAHDNVVKLQPEGLLVWVLAVALGCSLAFSFILVPLQCFHLGRPYGAFLLLFYAVFLLVALLTEFGKITVG